MKKLQSLPWADPLQYAAAISDPACVLLYSGIQASYSGRFSLLAFDIAETVTGSDFKALEPKLTHNQPRFANSWFGYFAYGLKNTLETLPQDRPGWPDLPPLTFMRFHTLLEFDHDKQQVTVWSGHENPALPQAQPIPPIYPTPVSGPLTSNMSESQYLEKTRDIISRIHAGELYQANLTRKFKGDFAAAPNGFDLFRNLCAVSPAAYSAYIRMDDTAIISSSPELFLKIDADGHIRARPVKGTSPRFADPAEDHASRQKLAQSPKDQAENLMITDLMRNDLARSCTTGSIHVSGLFEVTSHSNVHHMSSTITGQKRPEASTLDVIAQAFPPGSMTGAPKVMAMRLLSQLEKDDRGIYSGALGWLGGDGSAELSVVIRTLIVNGRHFEFQVGGGIVADSTPQGELQETIDKASGILKSLGLSADNIPK